MVIVETVLIVTDKVVVAIMVVRVEPGSGCVLVVVDDTVTL